MLLLRAFLFGLPATFFCFAAGLGFWGEKLLAVPGVLVVSVVVVGGGYPWRLGRRCGISRWTGRTRAATLWWESPGAQVH